MFMMNMYGYFNYSSKWHLEFQELIQILDTKGNKIIKNVKTKWMFML
jgi:transcription initiation factor IIE alpha subunit